MHEPLVAETLATPSAPDGPSVNELMISAALLICVNACLNMEDKFLSLTNGIDSPSIISL